MTSRLILCLLTTVFAQTSYADPLARCAAWLAAAPVATDATFNPSTVTDRWTTAVREVLGADPAARPWWMPRTSNPTGVVLSESSPKQDLERRLAQVQSDLPKLNTNQVALSQVIAGEDNIRRHLREVSRRAAGAKAGVPNAPLGFRAGTFTLDSLRALTYASVSSLFYVVGVEAAGSHRLISVAMAVASGVVATGRAQAYVTRAYLNIKNKMVKVRTAPVELAELTAAEARHAERLLNLLDENGGRTTAYLGFDLPVPRSIGSAGRFKKRLAPTAEQLVYDGAWPVDPRRLSFDQILYFDHLRREPVLLILIHESSYPQDPL